MLEDAYYDLENNDSRNFLSQCRLELCDFSYKLYITLFHVPETFYLSRLFSNIVLTGTLISATAKYNVN